MKEGGMYVFMLQSEREVERANPLLACVVDLWFLKYQIIENSTYWSYVSLLTINTAW